MKDQLLSPWNFKLVNQWLILNNQPLPIQEAQFCKISKATEQLYLMMPQIKSKGIHKMRRIRKELITKHSLQAKLIN